MRVSWRWVAFVLRGLVAVAAGVAAFTVSVGAATILFAAYFLVDGALALVLAARLHVPARSRLLIAAGGVVDLVVATIFFAYAPTATLLIMIVALWAIATGVLEFLAALFIPRFPALSWAIALVAVASCGIGVVLLDWANLAEIGLLYFFAAYALIAGVLFLTFGVVLWKAFHRVAPPAGDTSNAG